MRRRSSPLSADLAAAIRAGETEECAWELFRLQHYPGLSHEAAARSLAEWADSEGIGVDFKSRTVYAGATPHEVIYVVFTGK